MPRFVLDAGKPEQREFRWSGRSCTIGRAAGNDIVLDRESVSAYHARVEWRKDGFWIIDLHSTNGLRLNGEKVTEVMLRDGDAVRVGKIVDVVFSVTQEELLEASREPKPAAQPQEINATPAHSQPFEPAQAMPFDAPQGAALMRQGGFCPACGVAIPFAVNFCPKCGTNIGQSNLPAMNMPGMGAGGALGEAFLRPTDSGGRGAGIFPLLAFLCGLTGIGFGLLAGICHALGVTTMLLAIFYGLAGIASFFAITLGLVSLAQIRKHGGFEADRRQSVWGVGAGFISTIGCVTGVVLLLTFTHIQEQEQEHDRLVAKNEADVLADLHGIARAEKFAKAIRAKIPPQSEEGQFLPLEELANIGSSFLNRDVATGRAHGYRFSMGEANVSRFEAVAEPETYGVTGKRTFSIDQTGVLRAKDLGGKTYAQAGEKLPDIENGKTAFDEVDDAIAADVMIVAKRLASAGEYEQSRKLLDGVRDHFAITKAAQDLVKLEKSIDPFIVEAQAQTRYQQAKKAADEGDLRLAIGRLKEIKDLFPSYTKIATVAEEMGKYQTALTQKIDKEAKTLFENAEVFEREGKPDAALDLYVQIEKNFPETDWAKQIGQLKPALQKSIREKSAEQLLSQARNFDVATQYKEVVNLIEQILRGYGDTEVVAQNTDSLAKLNQKAQAQLFRAVAVEQMAGGQDRGALAKLEEAVGKNPDLRPMLKDLFLKLYIRVAQKRLDEGDEREALTLYRKYLALEPDQKEISPAALTRLNYAVAKSEFALGNFKAAESNLIGARESYRQDAGFNDLYGTTLASLGKFEDSLLPFDAAIAIAEKEKKQNANTFARRGYVQLVIALQIEKEALEAFANAPTPVALQPTATDPLAAIASALTGQPAMPNAGATAPAPAAVPAGPVTFATILPMPPAGVVVEPRIKYDAMASKQLQTDIFDLLEKIRAAIAPPARPASAQGQSGGGQAPTTGGGISSQNVTTPSPTPSATQAASNRRLQQVRTGVELGNELGALRQKILEDKGRKKKAADSLRLMAQLFGYGTRDLDTAIKLGATNAAELSEILKESAKHQAKISSVAQKIAAYLETEIQVADTGFSTVETTHRRSQMQNLSAPNDPTVTLGVTYSRLLDRKGYDEGLQLLRDCAEIAVPLERYTLAPEPAPPPPKLTPPPAPATPNPAMASQAVNK